MDDYDHHYRDMGWDWSSVEFNSRSLVCHGKGWPRVVVGVTACDFASLLTKYFNKSNSMNITPQFYHDFISDSRIKLDLKSDRDSSPLPKNKNRYRNPRMPSYPLPPKDSLSPRYSFRGRYCRS